MSTLSLSSYARAFAPLSTTRMLTGILERANQSKLSRGDFTRQANYLIKFSIVKHVCYPLEKWPGADATGKEIPLASSSQTI